MSTIHDAPPGAVHQHDGLGRSSIDDRTRFVVSPIAAPSILGLFGFAGATFIVAANLAGWYGSATSGQFLFPFAAAFGGVAQFAAGLWAYRARDAIATAIHGTWGSFWIAYGILQLLGATGVLALPTGQFPELGFWFLALAAITAAGTVATLVARDLGVLIVLLPLAVGAAFVALFYLTGSTGWEHTGGWVLIAASITAFYTGFALMLHGASNGRVVLPLLKLDATANVPGRQGTYPVGWSLGEPGVKHGQ